MTRTRDASRHTDHRSPLQSPQQLALGRKICRAAAKIDAPFDAEWFVSDLLGQFWERRNVPYTHDEPEDYEMALASLVQSIAVTGGAGARIVLETIRRLDRGALGALAGIRADALPCAPAPGWIEAVGTARVTGARAASLRGDGEGIFLLVLGDLVPRHTIAVYIDERTGGIAKHLRLLTPNAFSDAGPWDEFGDDVKLTSVDAVLACGRARAAIERTDALMLAPVGGRYAEFRMLVLARLTPSTRLTQRLSRAADCPPA
jgi:hypothetical protein